MKLANLERQLSDAQHKLATLEKQTQDLQLKLVVLELARDRYKKAVLDPTAKGYARIDTTGGTFMISVDDVRSYLDGYKIILKIGNPSSATYQGFTLNVRWGKRFDPKEAGRVPSTGVNSIPSVST